MRPDSNLLCFEVKVDIRHDVCDTNLNYYALSNAFLEIDDL